MTGTESAALGLLCLAVPVGILLLQVAALRRRLDRLEERHR